MLNLRPVPVADVEEFYTLPRDGQPVEQRHDSRCRLNCYAVAATVPGLSPLLWLWLQAWFQTNWLFFRRWFVGVFYINYISNI